MNDCDMNKAFSSALEKKIPKKTVLADFVATTLCMEKETAYRRLRGEVPFTLRETSILALKLNISLDEIIVQGENDSCNKLLMRLPKSYLNVDKKSPIIHDAIAYLETLMEDSYSEFAMALSGIPFTLFFPYRLLSRFMLLKYAHHADNSLTSTPYDRIVEPNELIDCRNDLECLLKEITETYYIWDRNIVKTLVDDIKYAKSIRLITDEDIVGLKKELYRFLNDLESLASRGRYEETGNKFELYISDAHIDISYAYISSPERHASMLSSFIFYMMMSEDANAFAQVNHWIKSLKRYSTLISGIGERERILFFDQQREAVDAL
ncbi:hypothetical protein M2480_003062 [Parabacteroides sp. PFB2-12]|nr:hypothetical protein [Parabacteroides sp. PM6-13]MDH6392056.1 hypothetical protein [Parabacteroides sp. PFB2-12]